MKACFIYEIIIVSRCFAYGQWTRLYFSFTSMREIWTMMRSYFFKKIKIVWACLYGIVWLFTNFKPSWLKFLNNKAVNTWLRSTHIHALSRPICGIVIKNLKSIKNRQILINVFFGLKPKRRILGCFIWFTHAHYSHAWLTLRLKNVLLKWYKHLHVYIAVTSKLGFCTEVYNFISLRLWLWLCLPDRYTMLGA